MAKITMHAGDFSTAWPDRNRHSLTFGTLMLYPPKPKMGAMGHELESIRLSELVEVETASEQSVKKMGGALGWGVAGGLVFGPVGLLAGLLLGGKRDEVTFVAKLKDGRKMLATTDRKTYTKLAAAVFGTAR